MIVKSKKIEILLYFIILSLMILLPTTMKILPDLISVDGIYDDDGSVSNNIRNIQNSRSSLNGILECNSLFRSRGTLIDIDLSDPRVNQFIYGGNIIYDESLYDYMGLEQIHKDLIEGTSGDVKISASNIGVAVVDGLVDFRHPNLMRMDVVGDPGFEALVWSPAVSTVVLINNQESDIDTPAYKEFNNLVSEGRTAYDTDTNHFYGINSRFYDYTHVGSYGHGTAVAGVINQVAPGAEIISIALPYISTVTQLYNSILNMLKWLKEKGSVYNIKIVNISNRWGLLETGELSQAQRDNIELEIENLLKRTNNKMTFVVSAGNQEAVEDNNWNLIYPSHLADNWEDYFATISEAVIAEKFDYDQNPAIATGFISVSSVYDFDDQIGLRDGTYVYDKDMDNTGDLKLMAPGFVIRTATNTIKSNGDPHDTSQTDFSGTSAAAPVVSGVAALLNSLNPSIEGYEIEKRLTEHALYDSNVNLLNPELLQKYGHGLINPIETLAEYDTSLVNLDSDLDGLLDYEELYLSHTDIDDADTDDDDLLDKWEFDYGTDPLVYDRDDDPDYDGLTNVKEQEEGTDPLDDDTDNDWLSDGDEINIYETDPTDGDSDDDTLPDGWEVASGYSPTDQDSDDDGINDPDDDNDGDGLTAFAELFYGTLDNNDDTDGDLINDYYEIHFTLTDPLDEDTDHNDVNDSEEDPDHDGLTNLEEQGLLTDPGNSDTDGDGLPDGWEVTYGLNPKYEDAISDLDGDNMNNLLEFQHGTDPTNPDCDNDGLNDKQEIYIYNTNPWDSDTDDDGLIDGYEVIYLGTDPANEDTDEDGLLDGEEKILGIDGFITDPLDPDTDDDLLLDGEEYTHSTNPVNSDTDSDSFDDYQELFTYSTDPLDYNSNPARISPNICRNFYGLPDGISRVYFTWNAPTNYWAGNALWSAWTYVLKIKIGTTWTTIYSGTSRSKNYYTPSATTSYSYRLYCYNQHTGVYSIYLSWYGAAKSGGGGGGPM